MNRLSQWVEHLRFKYGPRLANWLIDLSTYQARQKLKQGGPIGILFDNTVLAHATTHETAWINTGPTQWGPHTINTGYSARIAVHPTDSDAREYEHIQYLPGLISLARNGILSLYSSAELQDEQFTKPSGMFRGYGYYDHNLFAGGKLESIDGWVFPHMGPSWMNLPSPEEQRRRRLLAKESEDPEYASLVAVLGPKNSQDAWHIRTAEKHDLLCFLTMDFKLIRRIEAQRNARRVKELRTKVMTPAELGRHLRLRPIAPHILSYTDASYPVRSDLSWPDGKRRGRGRQN